ncbi:MAG: DUF2326 domain-containing protein [Bacteroides sp.]|nr:DUF2326 domain-containing protein [Bacteroides sp.]
MFLKYLKIENSNGLVRRIDFHQGLNLIVDETPIGNEETGNNVGKTTVLRLIDFCLGMDGSKIYSATEGAKVINEEVKDFLINTEVLITLCLTDSFTTNASDVIVKRNFLSGKKNVLEINGKKIDKKYFESELQKTIWKIETSKPSFRQIISHNFRYDEERLSQTLRTLNRYTTDVEYETLHLYMFGCNFDDGDRRQELNKKLSTDYKYKRRLEKNASKSALRSKLAIVENDINELNKKKEELHLNPDFEKDLEQLNEVKGYLSELAVKQSSLQLRYTLIKEAVEDLNSQKSNIDVKQLELIYRQASAMIGKLQHTFEELVSYHNEMLGRKATFVSAELPQIKESISNCNKEIASLRIKERMLAERLQQSTSVEALNELVSLLNQEYQEKGSLEQRIAQIEEVELSILENENILREIDNGLFSQSKQDLIQKQLDKFNQYYSTVSKRLYNESYAIEFSLVKNRDGKSCYKFAPFATDNFSTGKKQGEITCFDMAYIMFADDEQIPCLHFILNDRKELVHDNQLLQIGTLANERYEIQYVASILRDKLPIELNKEQNIVVKLSQHSKLFRIEEQHK